MKVFAFFKLQTSLFSLCCSGGSSCCCLCVFEASWGNGLHGCCSSPWQRSSGGTAEALQRLAETWSHSAGPVCPGVSDKVWGWYRLPCRCHCSLQADANQELRYHTCLCESFILLHFMAADTLRMCVRRRHGNKKMELFARGLQETQWVTLTLFSAPVCLCFICHLVWPCCVPYPVDLLSKISAVEVEPLPRAIVQAFAARFDGTAARSLQIPEADLSSIEPSLSCSLMPFQMEGVK